MTSATSVEMSTWAQTETLSVSSLNAVLTPVPFVSPSTISPRSRPLELLIAVTVPAQRDARISQFRCVHAEGYHEPDASETPLPDLPSHDCSPSATRSGGSSGPKTEDLWLQQKST
jgi:hypothetical protein